MALLKNFQLALLQTESTADEQTVITAGEGQEMVRRTLKGQTLSSLAVAHQNTIWLEQEAGLNKNDSVWHFVGVQMAQH